MKNTIHQRAAMLALSAAFTVVGPTAFAQDNSQALGKQLNALQQQLLQMQASYEEKLRVLENRLLQLEHQQMSSTVAVIPAAPRPVNTGSDLQIGLSSSFAAGGSNADNDALEGLQAGGHDPNRNGFTLQNVELSLGATVDPYFDARANIIFFIDRHGETTVELEEAFLTSRNLPWGLQLKGGQYYTEFGRHNQQHPHSWSFVDQPLILSRLFGADGLRSQGARLSWLAPTPWFSEVLVGAQNASGETVTSFLAEGAGEDPDDPETRGGHPLIDRQGRDQSDLLYSVRWLSGLDLSDTLSMNLGFSGLRGPNASGDTTNTSIVGADLFLKWQPAYVQRGFPFVSWHTEVLQRRFRAGDPQDSQRETLRDWGLFSQLQWGFRPGWAAGLRAEFAEADGGAGIADDPLRDRRHRLSPNLTWYPSEYSKLRLQYNRDWANHLSGGIADSLFLQFEFNIGQHPAHKF